MLNKNKKSYFGHNACAIGKAFSITYFNKLIFFWYLSFFLLYSKKSTALGNILNLKSLIWFMLGKKNRFNWAQNSKNWETIISLSLLLDQSIEWFFFYQTWSQLLLLLKVLLLYIIKIISCQFEPPTTQSFW